LFSVFKAFLNFYPDSEGADALLNSLVIPDSFGVLTASRNLLYNDVPWMDTDSNSEQFVHRNICHDIANIDDLFVDIHYWMMS
jgi:sacsin